MMRGKCVKWLVWHAMQIVNIAFTFDGVDIFFFTAINKNQIKNFDMCGQAAGFHVFSLPKSLILNLFIPEKDNKSLHFLMVLFRQDYIF